MNERRIKRLQESIKARIAEVLLREIRDPKIGLVTVTRVELDREFTICKVYWSVLGDKIQRAHTDRALKRAAGFVQREVGATLHTRTVPRLQFLYDEQIEEAIRIQNQLAELRREREAREEALGGEDQGDDASNADAPIGEQASDGDVDPGVSPEPNADTPRDS